MFTVKVIEQYQCKIGKKDSIIKKTRIFTTPSIEVDEFEEEYLVTINEGKILSVPMHHFPSRLELQDDSFIEAIYIENANGKTVHAVRSSPIIGIK